MDQIWITTQIPPKTDIPNNDRRKHSDTRWISLMIALLPNEEARLWDAATLVDYYFPKMSHDEKTKLIRALYNRFRRVLTTQDNRCSDGSASKNVKWKKESLLAFIVPGDKAAILDFYERVSKLGLKGHEYVHIELKNYTMKRREDRDHG